MCGGLQHRAGQAGESRGSAIKVLSALIDAGDDVHD